MRINHSGGQATSVTYLDGSGQEQEQPAALIILGAFTLNNIRLLLLSQIGQPYVNFTGMSAPRGGLARRIVTATAGIALRNDAATRAPRICTMLRRLRTVGTKTTHATNDAQSQPMRSWDRSKPDLWSM